MLFWRDSHGLPNRSKQNVGISNINVSLRDVAVTKISKLYLMRYFISICLATSLSQSSHFSPFPRTNFLTQHAPERIKQRQGCVSTGLQTGHQVNKQKHRTMSIFYSGPKSSSSCRHVVIAGAGSAGLSLALLLL